MTPCCRGTTATRGGRNARASHAHGGGTTLTPKDLEIGWRTVYGEARGEPWEGKVAVAWVLRNRLERTDGGWRRDTSLAGLCRGPYQFSCRVANDPNQDKLLAVPPGDPVALVCQHALLIVQRVHPDDDPTGDACH